jgi:hypothetical protein
MRRVAGQEYFWAWKLQNQQRRQAPLLFEGLRRLRDKSFISASFILHFRLADIMNDLTELIDFRLLRKIAESPKENHWSQSPLEKVTNATVLLDRDYFVLVKTEFSAPHLIRHATWRTEHVGGANKEIFRLHHNLDNYNRIERWFYTDILPESYGSYTPHQDYTLWISNNAGKAVVNLRQYPAGSYLLDLIDAYVNWHGVIRGGVSSYSGDAEYNDTLTHLERTQTLDDLIKQNRMRSASVHVLTKEGEFEGRFENDADSMTLVDYRNFTIKSGSDFDFSLMDKLHSADKSEIALQGLLSFFKTLLEEYSVPFR